MHVSNFLKGYETQISTEFVSQVKANNDELLKKLDELEGKIFQQYSDNAAADQNASTVDHDVSTLIVDLNEKIAELTAANTTLANDVENLKNVISNKDNMIDQLEASVEEDAKLMKEQELKIQKLEHDLDEKTQMLSRTSEQLDKLINKEENESVVVKQMLKDISDKISSSTAEMKNALNEKQASEIMDFILHLNETYFMNIPLSTEQFQKFVWNVPIRMYDAMVDQIDRDEPDILNPMLLLYLTFVDDPSWSMGHFLTKLTEMINENQSDIDCSNLEYIKSIMEDDEFAEYQASQIDTTDYQVEDELEVEEEPEDGQNESE